jgi:dCTP deaminase
MILPAQKIRFLCSGAYGQRPMLEPFHERTVANGMTFGLGPAGYDVRIKQRVTLMRGEFVLASTIERFAIPNDVIASVTDKSSWARKGLSLFNTTIEPGWCGWLTLEIKNQGDKEIEILSGSPIAQILFYQLLEQTEQPYNGRYQNQPDEPVCAIYDRQGA